MIYVPLEGIEPSSLVPETKILSIKLQRLFMSYCSIELGYDFEDKALASHGRRSGDTQKIENCWGDIGKIAVMASDGLVISGDENKGNGI